LLLQRLDLLEYSTSVVPSNPLLQEPSLHQPWA